MIAKVFLVAFLSLQSSNAELLTGDAALEGTTRFDVLNKPTTIFHTDAIGSKKTIGRVKDLNIPKVQKNGDGSQIPILLPSGEDAVIQRGAKEINVVIFSFPSSPPSPRAIKVLLYVLYMRKKREIHKDLR